MGSGVLTAPASCTPFRRQSGARSWPTGTRVVASEPPSVARGLQGGAPGAWTLQGPPWPLPPCGPTACPTRSLSLLEAVGRWEWRLPGGTVPGGGTARDPLSHGSAHPASTGVKPPSERSAGKQPLPSARGIPGMPVPIQQPVLLCKHSGPPHNGSRQPPPPPPPHYPSLWGGGRVGGRWEGDPDPVPFSRAGRGFWGLGMLGEDEWPCK